MATYNMTKGGNAALPVTGKDHHFVLTGVLDCTKQALAGGDVAQVLNVPPKTLVKRLHYSVETAEGAAVSFTAGDGTDPDGFLAAINGNALGSGVSTLALAEGTPNTVSGYSAGKYYAEADTIDLVAGGAAAACKIVIKAEVVGFAE